MNENDENAGGSQASDALYDWWFRALPAFFGAETVTPGEPAARSGAPEAAPGVGHVAPALEIARQALMPLYQAYLQALLANPQPDQRFGALVEQARSWLHELSGRAQGLRQPADAPWAALLPGWNLMADSWSAVSAAAQPLALTVERTYGGLADAFGLAPARELQAASRELASSTLERRQAQVEYLGFVAGALATGMDLMFANLREMGRRGETVHSLLALVRLWARSTDEAMHIAMQSPEALDASARLLRATTRSRRQLQRVVAIASETLNVPTRAEVDEAYREIQELKRELRRLRKSGAPAAAAAPVEEAPAATVKAPRGKAPAKSRNQRKAVA